MSWKFTAGVVDTCQGQGAEAFGLAAGGIQRHIRLMEMRIEYPDTLPDLLQTTRTGFEAEARMAMAVKLFELKRLSSGLAARLAGISRVDFLLELHRYGVAVVDLDEVELKSDLAHA